MQVDPVSLQSILSSATSAERVTAVQPAAMELSGGQDSAFVLDTAAETIQLLRLAARLLEASGAQGKYDSLAQALASYASAGPQGGAVSDAMARVIAELVAAAQNAAKELSQGAGGQVAVETSALRDIVSALRASGSSLPELALAREILDAAAGSSRVVVPTDVLEALANELVRIAASAIGAARNGGSQPIAPELAALLRRAIEAAGQGQGSGSIPGGLLANLPQPSPFAFLGPGAPGSPGALFGPVEASLRVSPDLLRLALAAARELGLPQELLQGFSALSPPGAALAASVTIPLPAFQALLQALTQAATQASGSPGGAPPSPTVLNGLLAATLIATEASSSATHVVPGAAAPPATPSAFPPATTLEALIAELRSLAAADPAGLAALEALGPALRSLAAAQPALMQQVALAMVAFLRSQRDAGPAGLVAREALFEIASAMSRQGMTGPSANNPVASLLLFLLAEPGRAAQIAPSLAALRTLGGQVEVAQANDPARGSLIQILLGERSDPAVRPLTLDLPARLAALSAAMEAAAARGEASRAPATNLQGAEQQAVPHDGRATARPAEPLAPPIQDHHSRPPEETPLNAFVPFAPPTVNPDESIPAGGQALEPAEVLLLTYEPELTRAWQLRQVKARGEAHGLEALPKGSLISVFALEEFGER